MSLVSNNLMYMKKQIMITAALILLVPLGLYAHGGGPSSQSSSIVSSDETVSKILADQDVSSVSEINCDNVSETDYEMLGETMMSFMHPDEEEHELMDEAMGGEGSETLEAMHVHMGTRMLGCDDGMMGPMMMGGMIGSGMMGGSVMGQPSLGEERSLGMMGGSRSAIGGPFSFLSGGMDGYGTFGVIHLLILLLAIFGLVGLIRLLFNKTKK